MAIVADKARPDSIVDVSYPSRKHRYGSGTPEGSVTGPVGSGYTDTDDGTVYSKTSGTGNTGWSALATA